MPRISCITLVHDVDPRAVLVVPETSCIRFVEVGDEASFITALKESAPYGCIVGHRLDPELRATLDRILLQVPDAHLMLGLEDATPVLGVPPLTSDRIRIVTRLPDAQRLRRAVRWAWFEGQVEALHRQAEARQFDRTLDRAIRDLFAQRLTESEHPEPEDCTLITSIRALAERRGVSESTLARRAKSHNVDLAALISRWKPTLVSHGRFLGTESGLTPWNLVYRRAGYQDASGGRRLLKRKLGKSEDEVTIEDLHRQLDELARLLTGKE